MNGLHSHRPVKQRRALLESNPPRDSWIERRRNKNVSAFGEAKTSPNRNLETFISEPEHAFQNSSITVSKSSKEFLSQTQPITIVRKDYLSWYPFFRSKRRRSGGSYRHLSAVGVGAGGSYRQLGEETTDRGTTRVGADWELKI